ncbi:c-type cytochrome domain-containing protein [Spirosoma montaniterrae]|uniref:Uncharacterized protein n=1 Tax=Spirosoma montaniterrae TaxID=1178516 RepID=A0A1P9WZC0_9BACT|nr:c-type cytochrome domain-containing protein [Spirosoma montaniterrae]AQG80726.1 hypothetical protein AWR27_16195 [Spirosoma montaniterrae]
MVIPDLLGRFHPLLVHLPIGILLFAAGLMAYGYLKKIDTTAAVSVAWGAGAVSAVLACATGWLLAQSGDYETDLVQKHQWLGLLTAGMAAVTYLMKQHRWLPALATVGLLSTAGHYGGNLTHGEDYLFPQKTRMAETDPAPQSVLPAKTVVSTNLADSGHTAVKPLIRRTFPYRDQIVPILKTNCYSCHSARKKKGGLRLDSEEYIRQGGKNGRVLVAGRPAQSKLFTYLLLPEDDERHMPPTGKRQPGPQQIAVIQQWIQQGAIFTEQTEVIQPAMSAPAAALADAAPDALPDSIQLTTTAAQTKLQAVGRESALLARPVDEPDQAVLTKLTGQQVRVSKLAAGANYLSVNFVNVKAFTPQLLTELAGVGEQVIHLRLSGQPVSDADLNQLRVLKHLTRLNVENTRITDAGLQVLPALPNLEQLNLYGTAITDAGLDQLLRCPNLSVLYLWQTQTTPEGIQRLQKARPKLMIETGTQQLRFQAGARPDTNKAL